MKIFSTTIISHFMLFYFKDKRILYMPQEFLGNSISSDMFTGIYFQRDASGFFGYCSRQWPMAEGRIAFTWLICAPRKHRTADL